MPLSFYAPLGLVIALIGVGLFFRTERRRLALSLMALGLTITTVVVAVIVAVVEQPG
jgi:hypothetical protein